MSPQVVKLGLVAKFVNGKAFKPTDWSEDGLPIIRIQNLNNKNKEFNCWNGNLNKQVIVEEGDLLLAWSGTPGTSFGAHIWEGGRSVLNQHIFRVDVDSTRICKKYAKLAINAKLGELIGLAHGGVGLQHVTKGMVEGLEILLPPLAEQQRIAAMLDKAESVLRLRERAITKLDEIAHSAFINLLKEADGRNVITLADVTVNIKNIKPEQAYAGKKFTYIDIGSVSNIEKCILEPSMIFGEEAPSRARQQTLFDDVLVSTVRPNLNAVAKVNLHYENPVASTGFCILRCDESKILPEIIFSIVKSENFINEMIGSATGASYPAVTDRIVKAYKFPKIPMEKQMKFADLIRCIENNKKSSYEQVNKSKQLIGSLQHQSFTVN